MNSVEKGKIEKIIKAEVEEQRREIEERRKNAFQDLKHEYEKIPPEEVLSLTDKLELKKEEVKAVEQELKELGYQTTYNGLELCSHYKWENGVGYYEYSAPILSEHAKETALKLKALQKLSRLWQLKLYSGNEEEEKLVLQFVNDFDSAIESEMSKL